MKSFAAIGAAAAFSLAVLSGAPASALTYDAGAEFTGDLGGSTGVWSYGYYNTGTTDFQALTDLGDYFGRPGAAFDTPLIGALSGGANLLMHPGEQLQPVVLRFTTLSAGSYHAVFQAILVDNTCGACGGTDGVAMQLGGLTQDVGRPSALQELTKTFTFGTGGGTIDFVLDAKSNYGWDSTGVYAAVGVPEPASWALMILGFGSAGAMLRRRRFAPIG